MTKQEFLAFSLPYGLKCQYEGIITFERELITIEDLKLNRSTNYKYNNKIGLLKQVHVFKKYWIARCGIKHKGLKVFYNGKGLYPVLHSLYSLNKPIEHKGETFVPIYRLLDEITKEWRACGLDYPNDSAELHSQIITSIDSCEFWLIQKLVEWHFDIADLISKGEAIDVNTLETNPYK